MVRFLRGVGHRRPKLPDRGAPRRFARGLAFALVAGAWTLRATRDRVAQAVGKRHPWIAPLTRAVLTELPAPPGDPDALVPSLLRIPVLVGAWRRTRPRIVRWYLPDVTMAPRWDVPSWPTIGDLASALALSPDDLGWLADTRHTNRDACEPLRHYHARWIPKRAGGHRLVEAPKAHLKAVQRKVLRRVLDRIPPHDAAFGFVRGRSTRDHASRHAGARFVLRMDLEDFFLTTPAGRVLGVFRAAGYPLAVARALAGLCLTVTPPDMRRSPSPNPEGATSARLAQPHLAQGAPTSPALANLCARRLDLRLAGLATKRGLTYSRYADDLTFSGDLRSSDALRLATTVAVIAAEEGYVVNHRKTRGMPASGRQLVTGVVVNAHPNLPRDQFDRLKAILHACVVHGPEGQDREGHPDFRAHLRGRVAWASALDARRGAKLAALFDRIVWDGPAHGPMDAGRRSP